VDRPDELSFPIGAHYAHTQQRQAHESPVLFYSVVLGSIGPVLAFGVPPIRERMGYRPPEPIPTTYPSASLTHRPAHFFIHLLAHVVPKRPRRLVQGYEDEV
jgi:hypothetical protein